MRRRERLSRVYLDDYPVTLMGDEAQPPLSRIVRAGGKDPSDVEVVYLTSPADRHGRRVGPDEIIDRSAEPTRPIYLRSVPRPHGPPAGLRDLARPTGDDVRRLGGAMPNVDPVVAQLGRDPAWPRRHHEPWVFRSPTAAGGDSKDTGPPAAESRPGPGKAADKPRDAASADERRDQAR